MDLHPIWVALVALRRASEFRQTKPFLAARGRLPRRCLCSKNRLAEFNRFVKTGALQMRSFLVGFLGLFASIACFGQGTIVFNPRPVTVLIPPPPLVFHVPSPAPDSSRDELALRAWDNRSGQIQSWAVQIDPTTINPIPVGPQYPWLFQNNNLAITFSELARQSGLSTSDLTFVGPLPQPVPEPGSLTLIALALGATARAARYMQKRSRR